MTIRLGTTTTLQLSVSENESLSALLSLELNFGADGCSRLVDDEAEKVEALTLITNHAFRDAVAGENGDRWSDSRPTSASEVSYLNARDFEVLVTGAHLSVGLQLKSTRVVALDIDMASVRVLCRRLLLRSSNSGSDSDYTPRLRVVLENLPMTRRM